MIKQFYEDGILLESFSQGTPEEDLFKEAELFSTGIHRGRNYTIKDLKRLADSFNAEEKTPLQLDHSSSVRDTVGFLESVSVIGNKLMGKVRIIDDMAKEKITKKLMKKTSISFYTDKQGNPDKIREVSLVTFPQVKTAQLFSEQPQLDDRKQALYKKAKEFQLQMKFRELQMKMEAEYQSYMVNLRGENTTKYTADQDREYEEYLQGLGLRNKGL
ncbi:hypothetical protein [Bacillus nitratireducens]|uniref:hypothetical protein n=1 Tax=Bacillus nitratireducens TaxID=2026193 RepID=UPI000BEE44B9|nr:hypothetical protein [Bacillus nitratireducens]PEE17188.1 hypothetical protein CON53_12555 [Bacillus cereus]MED0903345.1 hypothetical protein [Bacillus nitratireducens]PFH93001.1 hypothetical protein COI81_04820 [Bacillus cereus]PFM58459.1 hypothetical protein COJ52_15350 [Bacillus cereus]PGS27836.1 hypothetical protein COC55_11005 [Bacillus cereus]